MNWKKTLLAFAIVILKPYATHAEDPKTKVASDFRINKFYVCTLSMKLTQDLNTIINGLSGGAA